MVTDLQRLLKNHRAFPSKSDDELAKTASGMILFLSEAALYVMIKKASKSIGLEELSDVFQTVKDDNGEDDLSTRLMDLSIHLDHYKHPPMKDIKDLEYRTRNAGGVYNITRVIVADYLYLFPCSYSDDRR